MRQYRNPDGSITDSSEEHAEAWSKFADSVQQMFPGYVVYGMDPGLLLHPVEKNRYDTFSLPTGACKALLSVKEKMGPAPAEGHVSIILSEQELDSLQKILKQVYIQDFGSRIVDDARAMLQYIKRKVDK